MSLIMIVTCNRSQKLPAHSQTLVLMQPHRVQELGAVSGQAHSLPASLSSMGNVLVSPFELPPMPGGIASYSYLSRTVASWSGTV